MQPSPKCSISLKSTEVARASSWNSNWSPRFPTKQVLAPKTQKELVVKVTCSLSTRTVPNGSARASTEPRTASLSLALSTNQTRAKVITSINLQSWNETTRSRTLLGQEGANSELETNEQAEEMSDEPFMMLPRSQTKTKT